MKYFLTPVFSLHDQSSAVDTLLAILQVLQQSKTQSNNLQLAIRSQLAFYQNLNTSLTDQLEPFIQNGMVAFYPEDLQGSIDGLMPIRELAKEIASADEAFSKRFPGRTPNWLPMYADIFREEARELYNSRHGNMLIATRSTKQHIYLFRNLAEGTQFIPCMDLSHQELRTRPQSFMFSLSLRKLKKRISTMIQQQQIRDQENCHIFLDMTNLHSSEIPKALENLDSLQGEDTQLDSGAREIHMLTEVETSSLIQNNANNPAIDELLRMPLAPARTDGATMGPDFTCHLMAIGSKTALKRKKPDHYSPFLPIETPPQNPNPERPEREVTASMLGEVRISGADVLGVFQDGNLTRLQGENGGFALMGGISSELTIDEGGTCKPVVESAFSLQGDSIRGLRQITRIDCDETQISGRITNDFIHIDGLHYLILDSYIQHPWLKDECQMASYTPLAFNLYQGARDIGTLYLESRNSDGTIRRIIIPEEPHVLEESILLPGCAWNIRSRSENLGMEMIYGSKLNIDLPAVVHINRDRKRGLNLTFAPMGTYTHPHPEVTNGLMEHYSFRLLPNLEELGSLPPMKKVIWDHIYDPFISYT